MKINHKEKALIIICLVTSITLFLVLPIECYTQSASHVPQFQKGDAFILITDLSGMGPSVIISFYDDYGREISVINKLLRPRGKLQINIEEYLKVSGCIVVESSNESVLAEYWLVNKDNTFSIIPFQAISNNERYFINCSKFSFCQETYIVLSDPNGKGPMVQMEFYSKTGELVKIIRKMLRPHGILIFKVSEHIDKDIQGKVSVRSFNGGISIQGIQICNKKPIFILPTYASSKDLLIGNLIFEKGFANYLVITDLSAKESDVNVSLFDNDGNLVSEIDKTMPTNSTIQINLSDEFVDVEDGIIKIRGNTEISASYYERNTKTGDVTINNAVLNHAITGKSKYSEDILSISYFDLGNNTEFMLSLLNFGIKTILAELEFYDSDGKKIGSKKVSLEPDKNIKESVNQYFGKSHLGTIIIKNSNLNLVATSNIVNFNNGRLFGKIYAISR